MELLFIQMFKASGAAKIIVSEISDYRAKFAYDIGANRLVSHLKENLVKIVKEETLIGADVVVDTVGTLMKDAIGAARRGGRVLLFGQNYQAKTEITQNDITRGELTIMGSFIAKFTFPAAIKIIESNLLNLEKLITHRLPLENIHKGIEAMRKGKAIKVIVTP